MDESAKWVAGTRREAGVVVRGDGGGGWIMEDGGWRVEDGRWIMEDGGSDGGVVGRFDAGGKAI
jgi:hypothetical protein